MDKKFIYIKPNLILEFLLSHRKEEQYILLDKLITDCITYSLNEEQAMEYIKIKFGKPISRVSYYNRKTQLKSDEHANEFIHFQTRLGFVLAHEKHIRVIDRIMDDTIRRMDIEMSKEAKERDEQKILELKEDLRRTVVLAAGLNVGNPVIARMKADVDRADSHYNKLLSKFKKLHPDMPVD